MKLFQLFPFAKKLPFLVHFFSFYPSVAMLCKSKKPSNDQKISNFHWNVKSINHFYSSKLYTLQDTKNKQLGNTVF